MIREEIHQTIDVRHMKICTALDMKAHVIGYKQDDRITGLKTTKIALSGLFAIEDVLLDKSITLGSAEGP